MVRVIEMCTLDACAHQTQHNPDELHVPRDGVGAGRVKEAQVSKCPRQRTPNHHTAFELGEFEVLSREHIVAPFKISCRAFPQTMW